MFHWGALGVIEGNCFLMPERFGSLVRAFFVWTALEERFRYPAEVASLRSLLCACCRPLPKRCISGRRHTKSKLQQLFVSVLRTVTVGTTGLGRGTRSVTGQILPSLGQQQQQQPNKSGNNNSSSFHRGAEEEASGAAYVPVLFPGGSGFGGFAAWPGFPISASLLALFEEDPQARNAVNQLARTEPEMLRSDLVFLLRPPCGGVLEPANKLFSLMQNNP